MKVEPEHPAFHGHFPSDPILSGLIQVDWAIRLGGEIFGDLGAFCRLDHLKFKAPIRPAEPVALHLSWDSVERHLDFNYSNQDGVHSQGIVVFSPAP
jgi:3-hydroxymyristoyl/3-hydroxydecanoyl-(acyl carrier protein) dehydratase